MTFKQWIFGVIGGMAGVLLCVAIGFIEGTPWFGFIGMIVGLIVASIDRSTGAGKKTGISMSKEEQERVRLEKYIQQYKVVVQKLPEYQLNWLVRIIVKANAGLMGLSAQEMPQELIRMGAAVAQVQKSGQYGKFTTQQAQMANEVLEDLEFTLGYLIPAGNMMRNQAVDRGLGFDIIGSASQVALHSVMDTMERQKNYRVANYRANEDINKKIKEAREGLQRAIAFND